MTSFAKSAFFSAASYATFRPSYPAKVFRTVLDYHQGPKNLCVDLGCGHGIVTRELSSSFTRVIGTDPSPSMIKQAVSSSPQSNVSFREASAEDLSFIEDGSLDMVVAGQAAHWFDYSKVWPALLRKLRRGGTVAFWGYKDNVFVDYPKATQLLLDYCYDKREDRMGSYWEPGRFLLRNLLREVVPPEGEGQFGDVVRSEYEPGTTGANTGVGERWQFKTLKLGEMEGYMRTFSCFHRWQEAHHDRLSRLQGGEGDVVDEMFDEMLATEPDWRAKGENWRDFEVEIEWGSIILMARKK